MIKDNLGIKFFALILAILIWLQSVLVSEHRSIVSLPVNLRNMPQNITLENIPQNIPFTVRGKGLDILRLMLAKPRVNIDASGITPHTDIISLQNYAIDMPENMDVTLLGPAESDQLAIQADVFHQKVVGIEPVYADNYTQKRMKELRYSFTPDKVTIFGPKNKIQSISKIKTMPIEQEQISESRVSIELDVPDAQINVSEKTVLMNISGAQESSKVFTDIVLPGVYMQSRVAVRLSGPGSVLEKLSIQDIKAKVSAEADSDGFYGVELELPEGVNVIAITPNRVRRTP